MATSSKRLKIGKILIGFFAMVIVSYFVVNTIAERKLKDLIERKLPDSFTLTYDDLQLNLFLRSVTVEGIDFRTKSQDSSKSHFTLTIDAFKARKIDVLELIEHENLNLGALELIGPSFYSVQPNPKKKNTPNKQDLPQISIESLQIKEAQVCVLNQAKRDTLFWLDKGQTSLHHIQINSKTPQMLVLDTTLMKFHTNHLKFKLSTYETLETKGVQLSNSSYIIDTLKLKTKYDWATYSQKLHHQRDHYDLTVDKIMGFGLQWPFGTSRVGFISDSLSISKMDCIIFRDKTLPDDTSTKTYFMESLSQLNFPLHIAKVSIADTKLSYFEETLKSNFPEPLVFSSINGNFTNISNKGKEALAVNLSSKLMGNSPMELKLETEIGMPLERFVCSGTLYDFSADEINPFLSTNVGVKTKGNVQELYFTMSGDRYGATGDMKVKYDDFEFEVLKKDLLGVRKTTSFILNIFVNRGNRTDENGYRYGQMQVTPKTNKSFTNFLWLGVQDGLLDAVTGSGKKRL